MPNELRVTNHASVPVTGWVPFVVPRGHGLDDWEYVRGSAGVVGARQDRNFDPARDATGGDWVYAVHGTWQPGEQRIELEQAPGGNLHWAFQAHAAYGTPAHCSSTTWNPDRWATVRMMGESWSTTLLTLSLRDVETETVYEGNRYRVLRRTLHAHGFHLTQYLYLSHRERLSHFTLHLHWSDETAGMGVKTGSAFEKHCKAWTWPEADPSLRSVTSVGFIVEFGGSTLVRGKWQANEGWETLAGVRRSASTVGPSFRMPLSFAEGLAGGSTDWGDWRNRWHHGPMFALRGWMSTDSAELQAANHLQGLLSPADWNGHYLLSGVTAVTEPANPEAIVRPRYSDTTRHWMSWDRGSGAIDSAGGIGLHLDRSTSATSTQGSFGLSGGHQLLHRPVQQPLYDFECAMLDWARRPQWRWRDGSLVIRGDSRMTGPLGFALQEGLPRGTSPVNSSWFFGRDRTSTHLGVPQSHNDPTKMGQFGEDNQHHSCSTLIAYYQLTLDPAAYEMIALYATQRCLDSRIANWGSDADLGDHREISRKLGSLAMIPGTLPAGDAIATYVRNTIGHGGRGVYPNQTFKLAYKGTGSGDSQGRFMLSPVGRAAERPWQSWPKTVRSDNGGNPEFIPATGTVVFGTSTITRTDDYFTTEAGGGRYWAKQIRRRVVIEGGSNAGYWYVLQRRTRASCTVTGGDTVTLASGSWANTPIVGAWLWIDGGSLPSSGVYVQVVSATANSVTVTGATLTNETAMLTILESTLDVTPPHGVDVDWTGKPLLNAGHVIVSGTSVTPSSGPWLETPATLANGHGLGYVSIKINDTEQYHAKIASATSNTITLTAALIPSRSYSFRNVFWNVAATGVLPLNAGTQTGIRAFVIENQNDNLDTRICARSGANFNGAVIFPHFDCFGVQGAIACYLATGDPEWRDWAIQAMDPLLRYAVVTTARGQDWLPWILVADEFGRALPGEAQLRNARGAPRSVAPGAKSESPFFVAMGGEAFRSWCIGSLNWYRQLPAGQGDAALKAVAQRLWSSMQSNGNYLGWLQVSFAAATGPL